MCFYCTLCKNKSNHFTPFTTFTPQPQGIAATWLVLIAPTTEGWPGWVNLGNWLYTEIDFPAPGVEPRTRSAVCLCVCTMSLFVLPSSAGEYKICIVRPKASWAGLICRIHQHHHRQWLPNTEWSNSGRWAWAKGNRRLRKERRWKRRVFKTRLENRDFERCKLYQRRSIHKYCVSDQHWRL